MEGGRHGRAVPTADRTTRIRNLFAGVRTSRLLGLVWFDA